MEVFKIRHPGTGEWLEHATFQEAMDKSFEGFNLPFKVTDGECESFDDANQRVKEHYEND